MQCAGALKSFHGERVCQMNPNVEPLKTADSPVPEGGASPWRLSVAPMIAWTDKHCRYFHRLLTQEARLYTEMITTGVLMHGDVPRHLDFNDSEHAVALQLGGSESADLAHCARLGERWGYDEINLNCGCPSERVLKGSFGACLMNEPQLVADGVKAMRDAVSIPVTVKHRIGIDDESRYSFVRDFVGTIADAGCEVFIVHARNAWLKGLSPKENREIPPLRYEVAHQLKRDFPQLTIVINGGIATDEAVAHHLQHVDGVMVGREAYQRPWWLTEWDERYFGAAPSTVTMNEVEEAMCAYMEVACAAREDRFWPSIARHMLGMRQGQKGSRRWRQVLSDFRLKHLPVRDAFAMAHEQIPAELEA